LRGLDKGDTVTQLSSRVGRVLGETQQRANAIARNEAGQAVSTGRFLASAAAGVSGKGWLHGRNARPSHVEAQRDYARAPIALDDRFSVGSARLMFPRDPSGPADEIINCNCVMVPRRLAKKG